MSEQEMMVQVSTADVNEIMTITVTPTSDAASNPNSAPMSSDQEGVIATSALQMVDDEDIIDGKHIMPCPERGMFLKYYISC